MPSGFGKHLWDVTGQQLQGYLNVSENTRYWRLPGEDFLIPKTVLAFALHGSHLHLATDPDQARYPRPLPPHQSGPKLPHLPIHGCICPRRLHSCVHRAFLRALQSSRHRKRHVLEQHCHRTGSHQHCYRRCHYPASDPHNPTVEDAG